MRPASVRRFTSTSALLGLAFAAASALAGGDETRDNVAALSRQTEMLEKRVELAGGDDFYLLLDPTESRLRLMLKGAVLRDYSVLGLEVGVPRVAFRPRHLVENWKGRVWSKGTLLPARERDRVELVVPPVAAGADTSAADSASTPKFTMPPLPEEAYPVPHRYHIRYEGGLSLEVRPQEADQSLGIVQRASNTFRVWYRDFMTAIHPSPEDQVRLRVVLQPQDAASLYRALPPDTRLLVIPTS